MVEKDRSGLQTLAAGVIEQALADAKSSRCVYREEAIRFLDSKEFQLWCNAVGWSASYLRAGIYERAGV